MENKLNSGVFFLNDRKQNDRQPDFTGTANINGKEMRVSIWSRQSQGGRKYWSMSFSDFQQQNQFGGMVQTAMAMAQSGSSDPQYQAPAPANDPNDDLPF